MGWAYAETAEKTRQARALTASQRQALTWEEALVYIPRDTLCLAAWMGCLARRKECTPWQAVARVLGIEEGT